ncbi:PQQ-dependent sugar dehydrogenase [Segetibacter aerophilus]|uniref:Glucose/Sorbosone dehydrogenase domain-containing protein n=1 Tax=Segetibacter aerophilus TaxID=670293 RepID=A0A512BB19_9BACT|nr:PQQ-dependent sugar dehydrogenase [Segetibacter aerophilus]GEO09159.1 hypothetical protein SAE01_16550 [Segetibacter aerophilus]
MKNTLLPFLLLIAPVFVVAQPLISFQPIVSNLSQPVDMVEANDNSHQFFIVERTGKIRLWKNNLLSTAPFLDVTPIITASGSEQGLLSMALHPDYKNNGYFFIYYTNTAGAITVARYQRANENTADPASGVVLLTIPKRFPNHNGGHLLFGQDGYLYFATGDGGSAGDPDNNAQNGQSLLGKMIRVDVNNPVAPYYKIPPTNPFIGSSTTREEIIATGLRNPWRWSFDRQTGDMWIADVGQNLWEEVNVVSSSSILNKDYGWSCLEGTHAYKGCAAKENNVSPIFEYPHNNSSGGFSITGGYVYRGSEFTSLQGYYICSDFVSGNGWLIKPNGNGGWSATMQASWPQLSSFAEGLDGTLYALALSGTIYKINAGSALPLKLISFVGKSAGNMFELKWQVQNETAGDVYIVERKTSSSEPFTEISRTKASINSSLNNYSVKVPASQGQSFYRLKTISMQGQSSYSAVISANNKIPQLVKATVIGSSLSVAMPSGTTMIEVFDASGKALKKQKVNAGETHIVIPFNNIAKGIISLRATVNGERQSIQIAY